MRVGKASTLTYRERARISIRYQLVALITAAQLLAIDSREISALSLRVCVCLYSCAHDDDEFSMCFLVSCARIYVRVGGCIRLAHARTLSMSRGACLSPLVMFIRAYSFFFIGVQ